MKIIVGGGVSGLWLAAECQARGIPCVVLEQGQLGGGQTLASQGMIHGGTKYALNGLLSQAATAIAEMPTRWLHALQGQGAVDLSGVTLAKDEQLLWSIDSMAHHLVGFFASKAMRSRMQRIDPCEEEAFAAGFSGQLYRLAEPVIVLPSLIARFAEQLDGQVFQAKVTGLIQEQGAVVGVETTAGALRGEVILCAGAGNQALCEMVDAPTPAMQRRPLAMTVATLATPIPDIFGHQLGASTKPKLTVSTHWVDNTQVLYLGGQLAEDGVHRDDASQCEQAALALHEGLRWLNPRIQSLSVFRIDRAEPATAAGGRPDHAFVERVASMWVCWPTKLALAPALADQVLNALSPGAAPVVPSWPAAVQGGYPWASQ